MIDKETYKKELKRMFDSLSGGNKSTDRCGIKCSQCPLKKICNNNITLYRCLFCSYIFTKRESKLYSLRSIPTDTKSPVGNGYSKALTHLLTRQVTKSHLYKVFYCKMINVTITLVLDKKNYLLYNC